MDSPAVSVVVCTYNALPWIEPCLESVRGFECIVVDNGSTDETLNLVRKRFPEVIVLEHENRGLGAAWNAGVARASRDRTNRGGHRRLRRRRGRELGGRVRDCSVDRY